MESQPTVLWDIDFSYPGIGIKVEFIVMQEYLNQMESSIQAVCQNYIKQEEIKYSHLEFEEYVHIYSVAEDMMPRIIRMPFVVTIYTLFENSIELLLKYAQEKENKTLGFKDINGDSLVSKYNKYMEHILNYEFKFNSDDIAKIKNISKVRNFIAHTNGNIDVMSKDKMGDIKKLSENNIGIIIEGSQLDVSYDFLNNSMRTVNVVITSLMEFMENKYNLNAYRNYHAIKSET